jgi:uncharacterized protein
MATYKTPGVYIEEIPKFPPSVAPVATAIPAFIGYTEKAKKDADDDLILKPTRISSLLEYEDLYGGPQAEKNIVVTIEQSLDARGNIVKETVIADFKPEGPSKHLMYYAFQQYFNNGGGPCYIISVAKYLDLGTTISNQTLFNTALENLSKEDEPTLIVFPEGQSMDTGTYQGLIAAALLQCTTLKDRFTIIDFHVSGKDIITSGDLEDKVEEFRGMLPSGTDLAKYGAAYFPNVRSTFNYTYDDTSVTIVHKKGNADGEHNGKGLLQLPNIFQAKVRLAIDQMSIFLPPSGPVTGVYARVDNLRGVWKAPANESILSVNDLTYKITDRAQEDLNVDVNDGKSINCIRHFTGKGIKIWGARTLAGNDNEWRYVPVRRFFNMVEESVKKATTAFVFEPNDRNTWVRVRAMIENFLILQWRAGALAGAVPEHAFYVKVGLGETMTALDILEGRMIVEIGMAVVRPAEFIILKFSHKMQES